MDRRKALTILGLRSNASPEQIKRKRLSLIKAAAESGEDYEIPRLKEAARVALETQGSNTSGAITGLISVAAKRVGRGFRKTKARWSDRPLMPWEEALIASRIAALPKRVSLKCAVTGKPYSVAVEFDFEANWYRLSDAQDYRGDPFENEVEWPVLAKDLVGKTSVAGPNSTAKGSGGANAAMSYKDALYGDDPYLRALYHYSQPTRAKTAAELFYRPIDLGRTVQCPHCETNSYQKCMSCGYATCHSLGKFPRQWGDKTGDTKVPCPYCSKPNAIDFPHNDGDYFRRMGARMREGPSRTIDDFAAYPVTLADRKTAPRIGQNEQKPLGDAWHGQIEHHDPKRLMKPK